MKSRISIGLMALLLLIGSSIAHAELKDFLTDLYGGDGITLPQANLGTNALPHVAHFNATGIAELSSLTDGILAGTGVFALNSTTTGITFDLSQGIPVAVEDSLGPLLAERASTIGQGRLSIGFGFSRQDFDELDGKDLGKIRISLDHVGATPTGFRADKILVDIDMKVEQEVYALFSNYGVTDRWDIGVLVPFVSVDASASAVATVANGGTRFDTVAGMESQSCTPSPTCLAIHTFTPTPGLLTGDSAGSSTSGSESGLGDIVLRTKYNFLSGGDGMELAVLGQVTLPTGEEDDLLGTGKTVYKGMLIASKSFGRVTPHLNLAYELADSGGSNLESFTYAVGFDARLNDTFTAAIDVLGRNNPNLDSIGNNIIDLAVAIKWNPFDNSNAPLHAFVSFPLNDDGLRADFVWGVGLQYTLD